MADNMECNVTSVSESTITCTFTNPIAGSYNVSVFVKSIGKHYIVINFTKFWVRSAQVGGLDYLVRCLPSRPNHQHMFFSINQ